MFNEKSIFDVFSICHLHQSSLTNSPWTSPVPKAMATSTRTPFLCTDFSVVNFQVTSRARFLPSLITFSCVCTEFCTVIFNVHLQNCCFQRAVHVEPQNHPPNIASTNQYVNTWHMYGLSYYDQHVPRVGDHPWNPRGPNGGVRLGAVVALVFCTGRAWTWRWGDVLRWRPMTLMKKMYLKSLVLICINMTMIGLVSGTLLETDRFVSPAHFPNFLLDVIDIDRAPCGCHVDHVDQL